MLFILKVKNLERQNLLSISNVKKSFGGTDALKGVNFDIGKGEIHALVGENGAGKSTLVKIISGVIPMDSGEIKLEGNPVVFRSVQEARRRGVNVVYQELSLAMNLTVAENISASSADMNSFSLMNTDDIDEEAKALLEGSGIKTDSRVSELGIAAQQMVEIAGAISRKCKLLILDEPTASLTDEETSNLFRIIDHLKTRGVTIIYISHRLEEIFRICDTVTVFKDGSHVETRPVAGMTQHDLVCLMIGREMRDMFPVKKNTAKETVLELKNFSGKGFRNVSLNIHAGEIIGFAGLTGAGRTELFTAVFGLNPVYSGKMLFEGKEVTVNSAKDALKLGIGYLPEDRKQIGIFSTLSVRENIIAASLLAHSKGSLLDKDKINKSSKDIIESLGIKALSGYSKIHSLSGGNQQKVLLGRWMLSKPRVFIADEPTRGIDVGAKQEVFQLLREMADSGVAVIMISSELEEVLGMSNRIFSMYRGEVNGILEGDMCTEARLGPMIVGVGGNR